MRLLFAFLLLLSACSPRQELPSGGPPLQEQSPDKKEAANQGDFPEASEGKSREDAALPKKSLSFSISASPNELMVLRSTPVNLWVEEENDHIPEELSCLWQVDDGSPEESGCNIQHLFLDSQSDRQVQVKLRWNGGESILKHRIPLERLPLSEHADQNMENSIPGPPDGPLNFRLLALSDTKDLSAQEFSSLVKSINTLKPQLVVHFGDIIPKDSPSSWSSFREQFTEALRAAEIPLFFVLSEEDITNGAEIRRPLKNRDEAFTLIEDEDFPFRYSFSFKGVHFTLSSTADYSSEDLSWLRARLGEAQVYESRIVLSRLPLSPFSKGHSQALRPHFKIYEDLQRLRATALLSAAQNVYYKGRFGALSVLSIGSVKKGATLLGAATPQAPSLQIIDFRDSRPEEVFAVKAQEDGAFQVLFNDLELPDSVDIYTQ